jgi:glyoxylase-like metal-dependent hydrolase (beta-lactamase superfamily II)
MDSVKVLIKGYAKKDAKGHWDATSTTVLVQSEEKNVLIDPGLKPADLRAALVKEGLLITNIDIIVNSHAHQDHARNSKMFDKAMVFDPFSTYKKLPEDLVVPSTKIKVVFTPGHVDKHIAFLVDTAEGQCATAGDVIWWEDEEEQKTDYQSLLDHVDPVAKDPAALQESRKKLFSMADYVIPGHGGTFRISN